MIRRSDLSGVAQHLDASPQGVLGAEWHHELVLQKALWTVDAVPPRHGVQGVEERRDALDLAVALSWGHEWLNHLITVSTKNSVKLQDE